MQEGLIKSEEELDKLRQSSLLVGKTLAEVARHIKPGITTLELDKIAERFIVEHGALPGFKGYSGYPATLCTSVNQDIVHGIPDHYALKEGDIISVDCGTIIDGYYGDYAYTFPVGKIDPEVALLLERTKESLYKGIEKALAGNRTGDIGYAVQNHVEPFGYGVVRELCGHGIGRDMHEKPEVLNYGRRGTGMKLEKGMVICIEPMVNLGTRKVIFNRKNGWTVSTADQKPSAHFEHTVVITDDKPEIISTYDFIYEVLKNEK
ncbi:MAG: type I methionyl aminopeptidase [Bacteroidales bacterium]|nr:type I methionyl aminopeptidase [Bacteroidales bacterium]